MSYKRHLLRALMLDATRNGHIANTKLVIQRGDSWLAAPLPGSGQKPVFMAVSHCLVVPSAVNAPVCGGDKAVKQGVKRLEKMLIPVRAPMVLVYHSFKGDVSGLPTCQKKSW